MHHHGAVHHHLNTDIEGLLWTRVSRGCTLGIQRKDGQLLSFGGFRDKDLEQVQALSTGALGTPLTEEVVNVSGRSWGKVDVEGPTLAFVVGDRASFRLPLQDVSQVCVCVLGGLLPFGGVQSRVHP